MISLVLPKLGANYYDSASSYYWSVSSQNCLFCPTNYYSGVGRFYQYQNNPITNRCYLINNINAYTFVYAQTVCQSSNGYLFPVGSIYEFQMAYYWTGGVRNYWLYGVLSYNIFTMTSYGYWYTWNSQTFSSAQNYWCLSKFLAY